MAARHRPDVVLMDLRMPRGDGAGATAAILGATPGTGVVVLTTYETDADIIRAVEAGALGYLLKDAPTAELASAIRARAGRPRPHQRGDRRRALHQRGHGEDAPAAVLRQARRQRQDGSRHSRDSARGDLGRTRMNWKVRNRARQGRELSVSLYEMGAAGRRPVGGHELMRAGHDDSVASAARARSATLGSSAASQLILGSRRNHASWRRANRLVARTVSAAACSSGHSPARNRSTCA